MEIEDDLVIIKDNKPNEPTEDPLEVHPGESHCSVEFIEKADNGTDEVINVDSSDDESCVIGQKNRELSSQLKGNTLIVTKNSAKNKSGDGVILRTVLGKTLNQLPLPDDIIDLDAEDSDPLAPLRSFMNTIKIKNKPNLTKNTNNCSDITKSKIMTLSNNRIKLAGETLPNSKTQGKTNQLPGNCDVSNKLTYLGKIIRIPGQPNVIEDSSGLIFRANSSSDLNNDGDSNSESDMNLYKNFLVNVSGQDIPNTSKNVVLVKGTHKARHKANQNVNTSSLKLLAPKNIHNMQQVHPADKTSNISDKKTQLNRIGNQKIIPDKPHKPNSTILDLNLNINDTGSPTSSINTMSPSQSTLRLPNDSAGGYNVALGLVVNVNDMNQSNGNYCQKAPQFSSLNNVALDVSFNVNNKGKPATITSKQATQNLPTPGESSVSDQGTLKDFTDNNSVGYNIYYCSNCSFQTGNIELIKSHVCPVFSDFFSSATAVASHTEEEEMQDSSNKNLDTNPIRHNRSDMFCCDLCSFKTVNSDHLELHKPSHYTTEIDISNTNQHLTIDSVASSLANLSTDKIEDKMYCCVACSFKTTDFEVISKHICPAVNRVITNNGNSYFKDPNVIHTSIPSPKTSVETENHQIRKERNVYKCAFCSYQTTNLQFMNFHECGSKNDEKIGKSVGIANTATEKIETNQITPKEKLNEEQEQTNLSTKFYCCVSCSFRTTVFESAQAHRCRGRNIKDINKPPPFVPYQKNTDDQGLASISKEPTTFSCQICEKTFKSKFPLFQHLRRTHFDVSKIFGCYKCYSYFEDVDDLLGHLELKHNLIVKNGKCTAITREEKYRCCACHYQTKFLRNIKPHFDKHMESYPSIMQICWRSFQQDLLPDTPKDISAYDCLLCGRKTNSIWLWLKHLCKNQFEVSNCKKKNEPLAYKPSTVSHPKTVKRPYKRKCVESSNSGKLPCIATESQDPVMSNQLPRCFHCKQQIIEDGLKCNNSPCENIYHLRCVDIFGRWLTSEEINKSTNWFCLECCEERVPVQEDIDHIEWCMSIANRTYLREAEKQSMWINEVKKIKQEKLALKEDFDRIKKFIMNCKSDRINNDMVKSVCTVVESFINAGLD